MKYMDSGNSQPNLSGNGQPIVSGGSQFGNQPQQSQPVIQTSVDSSYNDIISCFMSYRCYCNFNDICNVSYH